MKKINTLLYTLLAGLATLFVTGVNAQAKWDFSTMSQADKEACGADARWILGNGRYCYVQALDSEPLIANGVELEYAKGLMFMAGAPSVPEEGKAKVRCNYGSGRLELNGNNVKLIIPGLKAGQKVQVNCVTGKTGTPRGFNATNLDDMAGFGTTSTEEQACSGKVAVDGDVVLSTLEGGMYVYSVTVSAAGQGGGTVDPEPPVQGKYNDVPFSSLVNQVRLTVGNDIKYYDTDEVKISIDKAAGTVTVTPLAGTWQDVYTKTVSNISFTLAQSEGGEGDIQDGEIKITEARGWQESLYAKWEKYDGAYSYNVYVKGGQYLDWSKIDGQLVRDYGSYARADVVGLLAGGDYAVKIVAVGADGKEIAGSATEASGMEVVNYDRSGYAHFNRTEGVGAYNNDGTLKAGAKVLYVTANTAKTVSTDVIVDSKGKTETRTGIQDILDAYMKGYDSTPVAFRIIGMVDADDLDGMSSSSEGLQIKSNKKGVSQNITIEGIGDDATVFGFGFLCRATNSIEFRNFAIMNFMDDGISVDTDNSNIWIHNMDMFYGQVGSDSDQAKGDGTIDLKGNSKYITLSSNHFWDSGKSSLCGMTSESGENWITYHHNWFDHTDSRTPRVRTMTVHVYNNYYDGVAKYGIGATMGSSIFAENNYFRNTNKPMMISLQGSDIAGNGKGTFSGENGGMIKSYGNVFAEKSKNFRYVTYQEDNVQFDAYEASSREEKVPGSVKSLAGGNTYNNFDTNSSLIYVYTPDAAADVPGVVTGYYGAGRLNHGDFEFTFNNSVDDADYGVNTELKNKMLNYKSSLVGIFGDENAESGEQGSEGGNEPVVPNPGGDVEPGGDDNPAVGTVSCNFEGMTPSNPGFFEISGNYSDGKGTATVNGTTYSGCLKIESATSIKFTISQKMTLKLYFGTNDTKCNIKINGEVYSGDSANVVTAVLDAGSYELSKKDSCNLFYIELIPAE